MISVSPLSMSSPGFKVSRSAAFGNQPPTPVASSPPVAAAPSTQAAPTSGTSASSSMLGMGLNGNGRGSMPMSRFFFIGAFIAAGSMAMHGLIEHAIPMGWKALTGLF
jgi:hypothetical protein